MYHNIRVDLVGIHDYLRFLDVFISKRIPPHFHFEKSYLGSVKITPLIVRKSSFEAYMYYVTWTVVCVSVILAGILVASIGSFWEYGLCWICRTNVCK